MYCERGSRKLTVRNTGLDNDSRTRRVSLKPCADKDELMTLLEQLGLLNQHKKKSWCVGEL
jgi:hypothetical protein